MADLNLLAIVAFLAFLAAAVSTAIVFGALSLVDRFISDGWATPTNAILGAILGWFVALSITVFNSRGSES